MCKNIKAIREEKNWRIAEEDIIINGDADPTQMIRNVRGREQRQPFKNTLKEIIQSYCMFAMCLLMSLIIGHSITSHGLIIDTCLKKYSKILSNEHYKLLKNLCPAILYLGSTVGTMVMLTLKKYSYLRVIQLSAIIFLLGYSFQMISQHIITIFITRFFMGIASGISCIVIPQILYFSSPEGMKGVFTSFFPFFILLGYTSVVAYIPYVTDNSHFGMTSLSLALILIAMTFSIGSSNLFNVKKETGLIEVTKFMFQSNALKSCVSVILVYFFQKTTGIDLIINFSGSLFAGKNSDVKSIIPLIAAGLANIATGAFSDVFGKKLPIVASLSLICLLTFSMGIWGTNIWSLVFFTIIHNGGLGKSHIIFKMKSFL